MAGKGTRLRPFTLTSPKPLLEIIDKPIVEHLIDQITSTLNTDIDEIIYILGDESYFNSAVVDSLKLISNKYNAPFEKTSSKIGINENGFLIFGKLNLKAYAGLENHLL